MSSPVRSFAAVVLTALAVPAVAAATASPASARQAQDLLRFRDPRIAEASGVAVATREPGVYFVHNDSGDAARFFAVAADGRTVGTYDVAGATAVDWEDMAAARGPAGTPTLWFADIGDNDSVRDSVTVYAVPEPKVDPRGPDRTHVVAGAVAYRLRYPDGAHDAETLLVDPRGPAIVLLTKSLSGVSGVYRTVVPRRPGGVRTLRRAGTVRWRIGLGSGGPLGPLGGLTATGGAVSADGRLAVVRTYTGAYVWRVGAGGVAAALRGRPAAELALPAEPQGEAVAVAPGGHALVVTSEGVGARVLRVSLPALAPAPRSPSPTARPTAAGGSGGAAGDDPGGGIPAWGYVGIGLACVVGVLQWRFGWARRGR